MVLNYVRKHVHMIKSQRTELPSKWTVIFVRTPYNNNNITIIIIKLNWKFAFVTENSINTDMNAFTNIHVYTEGIFVFNYLS